MNDFQKMLDWYTDHEWCQGAFYRDEIGEQIYISDVNKGVNPHSACLYGCFMSTNSSFASHEKVHKKIGLMSRWNDDPERTFDDVKQLLETLRDEENSNAP